MWELFASEQGSADTEAILNAEGAELARPPEAGRPQAGDGEDADEGL